MDPMGGKILVIPYRRSTEMAKFVSTKELFFNAHGLIPFSRRLVTQHLGESQPLKVEDWKTALGGFT